MAYSFDKLAFSDLFFIGAVIITAGAFCLSQNLNLLGAFALFWAFYVGYKLLWLFEASDSSKQTIRKKLPHQLLAGMSQSHEQSKLRDSMKSLNNAIFIWFILGITLLILPIIHSIFAKDWMGIAQIISQGFICGAIFWSAQLYAYRNRRTFVAFFILLSILIALSFYEKILLTNTTSLQAFDIPSLLIMGTLMGWTALIMARGLFKSSAQFAYSFLGIVLLTAMIGHLIVTENLIYPLWVLFWALAGLCWVRSGKRATKHYRPYLA